jgi:hypothetical protein
MSTSPDDLVTTLSRWLARHVDDERLRHDVEGVDESALSSLQAEAVAELRVELRDGLRGPDLEMIVRETLEALALG